MRVCAGHAAFRASRRRIDRVPAPSAQARVRSPLPTKQTYPPLNAQAGKPPEHRVHERASGNGPIGKDPHAIDPPAPRRPRQPNGPDKGRVAASRINGVIRLRCHDTAKALHGPSAVVDLNNPGFGSDEPGAILARLKERLLDPVRWGDSRGSAPWPLVDARDDRRSSYAGPRCHDSQRIP
jgi:hypothetical protein